MMEVLPQMNENEPFATTTAIFTSTKPIVDVNETLKSEIPLAYLSSGEEDSTVHSDINNNSRHQSPTEQLFSNSAKTSYDDVTLDSTIDDSRDFIATSFDDDHMTKSRMLSASNSMRKSGHSIETENQKSILEPTNKRHKEKKLREFKSSYISISSMKLHGKDREMQSLKQSLDKLYASSSRAQEQQQQQQEMEFSPLEAMEKFNSSIREDQFVELQRRLLLLKGYSGTGKSALALSMVDYVENKYNGLFVSGKYDLLLRDEPYSGIIAACREICGSILLLRENDDNQGRSFQAIQAKLIQKLGVGIQVLISLIPELEEIVSLNDLLKLGIEAPQGKNVSSANQQENQAKLNYHFRIFLRVITSFYGPLVIVLDDLQWADIASLDLMEVIMTDRENSSLMMIGLYRSNEVSNTHILTKKVTALQEINRKDGNFDITEMEVGNLDLEGVKSVTMDLLSLDDNEEVTELSTFFLSRTQGNVFFLISFISMLEAEQLLDFHLGLHKYTWCLEKLKVETAASGNVVDLMKTKMTRLPLACRTLLSVAACLGASFELDVLEVVWNSLKRDTNSDSTSCVKDMLPELIEEGFVERIKSWNTFRWIHDKVQEAAHALIPSDELASFQIRIGKILCRHLSAHDLEASLFMVMSMLNEASAVSVQDEGEQISLAELNLKATQKSVAVSAFSSASKFAKKGIEFLPESCWKSHYELTLELYSYAAECAKFLGNDEDTKSFCDLILTRPEVPFADKFRANTVKSAYMSGMQNYKAAAKVLMKILAEFGHKFPKNSATMTFVTVRDFLKTKSIVKALDVEKMANLPLTTDAEHIQVLQYLDRLATCFFMGGHPLLPIVILKGAVLVLHQKSMCNESPVALAMTALIFAASGDYDLADKLSQCALNMLARVSRNAEARTKFLSGIFVLAWTGPYHYVRNIMLESYHSGMCTGDLETAMLAIASYAELEFVAGRRLSVIAEDSEIYSAQAEAHNHKLVHYQLKITGQFTHNLMGRSKNATLLEGDLIPDLDDLLEKLKGDTSSNMIWIYTIRLCLIFGEYEKGADLFIEQGFKFGSENPGYFLFMEVVCAGGLCCYQMLRAKPRKRKYKKFARKANLVLNGWCNKGNPNVQHFRSMFEAEIELLSKNYEVAEKRFQDAIAKSARGGFVHDAALGCELYSQFLLSTRMNQEDGIYHLNRSIEFYEEWGAEKKVDQLKMKLEEPSVMIPNTISENE